MTEVVFWVRTIAGSRNAVYHMAFPSFFHFRNQEPLLRALETEVNTAETALVEQRRSRVVVASS